MGTSASINERILLADWTRRPAYASSVWEVVAQFEGALTPAEALSLLEQAAGRLGADAAVFLSFIRDDAATSSYRALLACDPLWSVEYARNGWCANDPWLRHALSSTEPIRASEINPSNDTERAVADAASRHGFSSAVIVPAPSCAAHSRVGMLCLGSETAGYFEGAGYPQFKYLARGLAMELNHWWHRHIRDELITRARLTEDDLVLLRHEQMGHGSKTIAAALHTEAKTIDCRFQRVNVKLGMPNRRAAVRLAELYGLLSER